MTENNDLSPQESVERVRARKKKLDSKKRRRNWFIAIGFVSLAFIVFVILGLPSLEELENPKPQLATKVYSIDGEIIGQFFIENRIETDIDSLPAHLTQALVAAEDRKFYDHWGVDMVRVFKAIFKNIFLFSHEGASTITQQLSKNLYQLKSKNENFMETGVRKIREWITSIQIERNFTKKEILELYLNVSFFGKGAYGIETAARTYFDKPGKELTVPESAMLVALLKSHVVYDPEKRPANALRRRNVVIQSMVEAGYLDQAVADKYKQEPIHLARERGTKVKIQSEAPHFLEYIRQQVESIVDKKGYNLYRDGLSIYTTINSQMQRIANRVVVDHLKEYQEVFYKNWKWESNKEVFNQVLEKSIKAQAEYRDADSPSLKEAVFQKYKNNQRFVDSVKKVESSIQVGFVAIDPKNGQIRAMVGGNNIQFAYGLNHVTQIRRQPGSGFKPFVYAVALDNGYPPAYSLLNEKFDYHGWSPSNSESDYGGYMTLREALAHSVNVIAGRLTISDIAPPKQVIAMARQMGIKSPLSAYPSIALGTFEVSPMEMATGYSTIASGGVYHEPQGILRIEDRNGIIIQEFKTQSYEAMSAQTAALLTNMMQDVINYGTGASANKWFRRPAAGKTGTTQEFADAWFNGFTPQLCATAWVGFDDRRIHFNGWYGQGARAALPIWAKFMSEVYQKLNLPFEYFSIPDGVVAADFCKESIKRGQAALANSGCPEIVTDYILSSKMPETCKLHSGMQRHRQEKEDSNW
ncbi:MAG: PBP1A family penicillin-binding protein [Ignavibacteria bacterium]|nr:PBP1A family penicillin-binding protein [Ignavibacteria bacterium]